MVCCIKPPAQVTLARANDEAALQQRARRKCSRSSRQKYVKSTNKTVTTHHCWDDTAHSTVSCAFCPFISLLVYKFYTPRSDGAH